MEEFFELLITIIFGSFFFIAILIEMCWPFIIPIFVISLLRKKKSNQNFKQNVIQVDSHKKENINKYFRDIDGEKAAEFDNLDHLKEHLYSIFYDFETAYNNLDYNKMYNSSTTKLYNTYHTNIMLNLKFAQKKIIDQIKRNKMFIYDTLTTSRRQVIYTTIEIEYISYTQDHNGKVISGSASPVTEKFEVIFVKGNDVNVSAKCPNCGASVSGSTCEYCGTNVRNNDFKIDSIKKIV